MKFMSTLNNLWRRSSASFIDVRTCKLPRHLTFPVSLPCVAGVRRKFSSMALSQEEGNNSNTDAFVYYQHVNILDEKKQSLYLTKSVLKPGLPEITKRPLDISEEEMDKCYKQFEQNIIDSRLFCYGETPYYRKENSCLQILLNMLQIVWRNTSDRYPSNLSKSINYKQHVVASFVRNETYNIQISGKPEKSFLMMSKNQLPSFAMKDEIVESTKHQITWDDVYQPVFHFSELKTSFRNKTPYFPGAPYSNPHTLFLAPIKRAKTNHLIGQGLLYSFSHAFTHALSLPGNSIGMQQIDPVCVQCIINNGKTLSFICYQLNTLDFKSDDGVKNFVWIQQDVNMFDEAYLKIPGDKRFKGITETSISVEGFQTEGFETFLKFILNN